MDDVRHITAVKVAHDAGQGESMLIGATGEGDAACWIVGTDDLPALGVMLLQAHQYATAQRPKKDQIKSMAVTSLARGMALDAVSIAASAEYGISLHVHLGSTALRLRLTTAAASDLRQALDEVLG